MTIDIDRFLAPVSEDDPAGPDLAYDTERFRIEQAFEARPDDDDVSAVDWREIVALIVDQADRTKDIWLAIYLARAGAIGKRPEATVAGVQALAGLLSRYWEQVHPGLADYGFAGRRAACDTLTSFRGFISPLQHMPAIEHQRFGRFDAADLIRFARGGSNEEGYGAFRAALDDPEVGVNALIALAARIDDLAGAFAQVDATLVAHAGEETGSNFTPVYDALNAIRTAANALLPSELRDEALAAKSAAAVAGTLPDTLAGRADVTRALDLVIGFYRRHEPSSPIPLLMERAKVWVAMDFIDILEDLVPRSVDEAKGILSSRQDR